MKGLGRPVVRPHIISVRVTQYEFKAFIEKCLQRGISRSAALHHALKRWVMGKQP